jgi:hypothetical protein
MSRKSLNVGAWVAVAVLVVVGWMVSRHIRLFRGACPKCNDGWKKPCSSFCADNGTYTTMCCSNASVCDDDDGCEWYETTFVSDEQQRIVAECMAMEYERIMLAQLGMF